MRGSKMTTFGIIRVTFDGPLDVGIANVVVLMQLECATCIPISTLHYSGKKVTAPSSAKVPVRVWMPFSPYRFLR